MSDMYHEGSRELQDRFDTRRLADRLEQVKVHDTGFVRVIDEATVAFPNYDGNGMYLTMGNLKINPAVGLLFIDFERQRRMRVDGTAAVRYDDELLAAYPEAQFIVRVAAHQIYPNCPRYIHHYALVERSTFVPRPQQTTPIPAWKQSEWAADVLPANDPARTSTAEDQ